MKMFAFFSVTVFVVVFLVFWQIVQCAPNCPVLYHGIPGHTACLSESSIFLSGGVSDDDKKVILEEHNKYRSAVNPPACLMMKLYWDKNLAYVAQKWAENCKYEHERQYLRNIPGSFAVGENLAKGYDNWKAAIKAWHDEVNVFVYGKDNPMMKVGHYVQLIWGQTTMIGCGYAKCKVNHPFVKFFPLFVCHYGPSVNGRKKDTPYEKCAKNPPLQDCKGWFCRNAGVMKKGVCECECPKKYKSIQGPDCSTNCKVNDTDPPCKNPQICAYMNVPGECPWLCKTCPYIDQMRKLEPPPVTQPVPPGKRGNNPGGKSNPGGGGGDGGDGDDESSTDANKYSMATILIMMALSLLLG